MYVTTLTQRLAKGIDKTPILLTSDDLGPIPHCHVEGTLLGNWIAEFKSPLCP